MKSFKLTAELAAQYGGPILCLDERGIGRKYRLYDRRPTADLNRPITRADVEGIRSDVIDPDGLVTNSTSPVDEPIVTRVDISGPIEAKAGFHDPCGGYSDGHDAIAERLCTALEQGDVLLVIDSPGGAHAGLQQGVNHVLEYKYRYGRRVTGWADEMIGSAAYWWAACVCDEIYGPEAMIVGSIGARAAHQSIAGHLANDGIAVTYFASTPGKVAFAPELPLSKLGKARGDRDIQIAFKAFAEEVEKYRGDRGLTYDYIVELDADALPGQMAADAGLVDGVATYLDVLEYTQKLAASKKDSK